MNKNLTRIIGLALLVTATPVFASIDWGFDTSANPNSVPNVGSGTATISVGAFGEGWKNNEFGLGTQSGYWDLGTSGSILLSGLGLSGTYTLSIAQWVDSPPFTGMLTASVPSINFGFPFSLSYQTLLEGTSFGDWKWYGANLDLLGTDTITITGPSTGAIVDRIMLTVVPEPATMIAGALLLVPFAFSTIRIVRRNKPAQTES